MRLYSYVVARDYGFAPNPFHRYCTLATCKAGIRQSATVGDVIVGTGSATHGRTGYLVYAMRVTEISDFNSYWHDPRFHSKRPTMYGSKKQAYGDNIYHRLEGSGTWVQENSHHSLPDGGANERNMASDLMSLKVLVSTEFTYYGGGGPLLPEPLRSSSGGICMRRGHKWRFEDSVIQGFIAWWKSLGEHRCAGRPADW